MNQSVTTQDVAKPEEKKTQEGLSDKEVNFRKLEASREAEKEARIRAEMQMEAMRNELQDLKQMLQPKEADPLDGVEDYVDPTRLKAKLEKVNASLKKEAKEIARQTFKEEREQEEKRNFLQRLKYQFADYDQVMTESNIENLQKADPLFVEAVIEVPDEYARRLKTYQKIKHLQQQVHKTEEKESIREKVEENAKNPYYIPPSAPTPSGISFDLNSREAREKAYAKLKAAQKNAIGNVHSPNR